MNVFAYILMFALINSCIELEISAPGFPGIMAELQVSSLLVGYTITVNLLGFCLAASVLGPLSDSYGRRPVMLLGNGILMLGALGCVCAPSITWLLISRFLQGLGAATSAVVVPAIIADHFDAEISAKLYGVMNAIFTSLMAISPVLGGLIFTHVGWRGVYYCNVIFTISISSSRNSPKETTIFSEKYFC